MVGAGCWVVRRDGDVLKRIWPGVRVGEQGQSRVCILPRSPQFWQNSRAGAVPETAKVSRTQPCFGPLDTVVLSGCRLRIALA